MESKVPLYLISTIVVIAGIVFCVLGFGKLPNALASSKWPTADGKVTSSKVFLNPESTRYYHPEISYQYTVNDLPYTADKLSYHGGSFSKGEAQLKADEYSVGKEVLVYYNPSDPHQAVLERGVAWSNLLFPAIGVGLFVIGLLIALATVTGNIELGGTGNIALHGR